MPIGVVRHNTAARILAARMLEGSCQIRGLRGSSLGCSLFLWRLLFAHRDALGEGSIVGGAISHVRRAIFFLEERGAAALVDDAFVCTNDVLSECGPNFSIGGRLTSPAFKRFGLKAAGLVEFYQCILNHGGVGQLLVAVWMGEEEGLYLLDDAEHDLNGLVLVNWLIQEQEGLFDLVEARLAI